MSAPSFINFILKRPWLRKALTPLANWYGNAAGYRQLGLKYVNSAHARTASQAQAVPRTCCQNVKDK